MRLLLVRHGQTESNVRRVLDTAVPGPGLTELGQQQAAALPEALRGEPIEAVYASTQTRAELTAVPLATARELPIQVRDGLREVSAGDLEMRGDEAAIEQYLTIVFTWPEGDVDLRMPGGESGREVLNRFDAVVQEVADLGLDAVVVVSHGAMIRVWTAARARNVDATFAAAHALSNTGLVALDGDPASGWAVLSWEGAAVGGPALADPATHGPGGDPLT